MPFSSLKIYADGSSIFIKSNNANFKNATLKGQSNINDYNKYLECYSKTSTAQYFIKAQQEFDNAEKNEDSLKVIQIEKKIDSLHIMANDFKKQWLKENPNSPAACLLLYQLYKFGIETNELKCLFNNLTYSAKNNNLGDRILQFIKANDNVQIGYVAPDFSLPDTSENSFSLVSLRGKYVLLEFWASWCVPCRIKNSMLVNIYNRYKNAGFIIVSVSLDKKSDRLKWINAIKEDKLNWIHVSDLNYWDNKVGKLYGIETLPSNFIIDPNGKIIGKDLYDKELNAFLQENIKNKPE